MTTFIKIKVTTKGGREVKIPEILTTWFMDDLLQGVRNCFLTTFSLVYIFKIISMSQMKDKHARHSNGWYKFF